MNKWVKSRIDYEGSWTVALVFIPSLEMKTFIKDCNVFAEILFVKVLGNV